MSKIISKWITDSAITTDKINNAAVTDEKLAASAKQSALESKLIPSRIAVTAFDTTAASSDTVTTEVEAAATTDTPQSTITTAKGIYVGTVSGANDAKRVLIRAAGTDNGIDDGTGDDVYGILTEDTGVYTLSYKTAAGGAYSFSGVTSIDFYFVEICDLYSVTAESFLNGGVGGVVDAGTADAAAAAQADATQALSDAGDAQDDIDDHTDGDVSKHDATEIDYERADGSKKNIGADDDDVEDALTALDDAIGALDASPDNYTPASPAIVASHLTAIDTALSSAGGTSFSDDTFEIKDETTDTKKMNFQVSGVSADTTRTISMCDRNTDLSNITERKVEVLTLIGDDITAKYKDLAVSADVKVPSSSVLQPSGGIVQKYTSDYTIITDGSYVRRVNWDGLALDGVLEAGDVLTVIYEING